METIESLGIAWNTVDRWPEIGAACGRRSNDVSIRTLGIQELQADEIRTIVGGRKQPVWVLGVSDILCRRDRGRRGLLHLAAQL